MFKIDKLTSEGKYLFEIHQKRQSMIIVNLGQVLVHLETRETVVLGFYRF